MSFWHGFCTGNYHGVRTTAAGAQACSDRALIRRMFRYLPSPTASRKDHLHAQFKTAQRPRSLVLSLAALGLAALIPSSARAQDLFVSNDNANTISRFAETGPGTFSTTATTLSDPSLSGPRGLAFDTKGDLFVANSFVGGNFRSGSITELAAGVAPGTFGAVTSFTDPSLDGSQGLVFDSKGDLFVGNTVGNSITEFMAGAVPGTFGMATSFTNTSLDSPEGITFDARGDLFAANYGNNTITEFTAGATPGTFGPTTTLSGLSDNTLYAPFGLAVDAQGNLFAAAGSNGVIEEFASTGPGTFGPAQKFATGLTNPLFLAFDAHGNLFVSNSVSNGTDPGNTITEFTPGAAPGTFGPAQPVESNLNSPSYLAFGPTAPAVPEASTTVSLGLLLALGMGGIVLASRRKKSA